LLQAETNVCFKPWTLAQIEVEILSLAELVLNKFSKGKIVTDSWKKLLKNRYK
jgi:hypothetical protein